MSSPNITNSKLKIKPNLELKDPILIQNNYRVSRDYLNKTSPARQNMNNLSKVILKGKLFGLINKSNIMTDDQFNDIKVKLSLSKLEKYKENKKKLNEKFYYAQKCPNMLTFYKSPNKFEDDYINMRDLLNKKFTPEEQRIILSFPQFFQLNSNTFLKELVEEKHKNLYEIIGKEEKDEIERRKQKKINWLEYSNSPRKRKSILNNNIDINYENKIFNQLNNKNKNKSRNIYYNSTLFKTNNSINKNRSTTHTNNIKYKLNTYNNLGNFNFPLIKYEDKKIIFHKDIGKKYKLLTQKIEKAINEKFEKMKKRKELVILDNKKRMDLIKQKNIAEQNKKEQERLKIYHEKKYIEYIVAKLKKNYIQANKDNEIEEKDKGNDESKDEDEVESKNNISDNQNTNNIIGNYFEFLKKNEKNKIKTSIF